VLRMRFGIGMNIDHTLEEAGQQFSVTRLTLFVRERDPHAGFPLLRQAGMCAALEWAPGCGNATDLAALEAED
jgi:hypothetical protein